MSDWSSTVQGYLDNARGLLNPGIGQNYLERTLSLENASGNIYSQSPLSSASGLFQFTNATASQFGLSDVFDGQQNANAAARLANSNFNALSNALGQAPQDWQTYLAHVFGAGGAISLFKADPNTPAVSILGGTAVTNNVGKDFSGDPQTMTAGQLLGYIQGRYQGAAGSVQTGGTGSSTSSGSQSSTGIFGTINHYAVRLTVVVTGFIFLAVGLRMFRSGEDIVSAGGAMSGAIKPAAVPIKIVDSKDSALRALVPAKAPAAKTPGGPRAPRRSAGDLAEDHASKAARHIVLAKKHRDKLKPKSKQVAKNG